MKIERWLSKHKRNYSIQKLEKPIKDDYAKKLNAELEAINEQIVVMTKGLISAHSVGLKSSFSNNANWFTRVRNKWYTSTAQTSARWHQEQLILLYKNRKNIQTRLEKATGKYWENRIKRWVKYLILSLGALISLVTIGIGFLAAIYIIPTLAILIYIYILFDKNKKRNQIK